MTETGEQAGGTASAEWDCEAYGPEGRQYGALCFFSEGARVCGSPGECSRRMTAERGRVLGVIRELAATGDPVAGFLAGEFTSADQLLGGPGDVERESPETEATIAEGQRARVDWLAEAMKAAAAAGSRAAVRVECGPGVVEMVRSFATEAPAAPPWQSGAVGSLGAVPVVEDGTLPAGRWRMIDAAGEVLAEGGLE